VHLMGYGVNLTPHIGQKASNCKAVPPTPKGRVTRSIRVGGTKINDLCVVLFS
jgi:hypothetical protein